MRILIIGGTRFIGPRVARILVHHGHEVAVFHRGEHNATLPATVRRFEDPRASMPVTHIPDMLRAYVLRGLLRKRSWMRKPAAKPTMSARK